MQLYMARRGWSVGFLTKVTCELTLKDIWYRVWFMKFLMVSVSYSERLVTTSGKFRKLNRDQHCYAEGWDLFPPTLMLNSLGLHKSRGTLYITVWTVCCIPEGTESDLNVLGEYRQCLVYAACILCDRALSCMFALSQALELLFRQLLCRHLEFSKVSPLALNFVF